MIYKNLYAYARKFGFIEGINVFKKIYFDKVGPVHLSKYGNIHIRRGSSDIGVFKTVFVNEFYHSYALEKILPNFKPVFIIDAGANIGLSAMYFSKKYPGAKVIAIEPESSNYKVLCSNIEDNYPNIIPENKALWFKKTRLSLSDPNVDNYAFTFHESQGNEMVDTITIPEIINEFNLERIGIVKIDIEGSEREIFLNDCSWLQKVDILIIELHDFSTRGCSKAFYSKILEYDFSQLLNFENVIMVNESILNEFRLKK